MYTRARARHDAETTGPIQVSTALEAWATRVVCEYLDAHTADLERAARLEEKAKRLEKAGTPSESARNQAERMRREVVTELAALRASFVEAAGKRGGAYAFDRAVEKRCPAFKPRQPSDGHLG